MRFVQVTCQDSVFQTTFGAKKSRIGKEFVIGNIETSSANARPFLLLLFSSYPRQTDHNESVMLLMNNVNAGGTALPASYKSLIYI